MKSSFMKASNSVENFVEEEGKNWKKYLETGSIYICLVFILWLSSQCGVVRYRWVVCRVGDLLRCRAQYDNKTSWHTRASIVALLVFDV